MAKENTGNEKTPDPAPTPAATPKATPASTPKATSPKTPDPAPTPTRTPEATPNLFGVPSNIEKQLKALDEQRQELLTKAAEEALAGFPSVVAWIGRNMTHFGDNQIRLLRMAIGETVARTVEAASRTPRGAKSATKKAAKKARASSSGVAKFRLPDGTEWNGKGRAPSAAFLEWGKTPEGKKWKKANTTKEKWPLNPEWVDANPGKVSTSKAKPAKKATKKVAKKAVSKTAKKTAKKATKKTTKKPAK